MKKLLLLFALLTAIILSGCVAQKVPGKHGFYSTKSPSLTVKFNGLEYQGESKETKDKASVHTYFYAGRDGGEEAWVEIITMRQGWSVRPKKVPGEELPNTGIYTRNIAGESYYCRSFLVSPGSGKNSMASLPGYTAIRICTKLISPSQKISIGFAGEVNNDLAKKLFSSSNYGDLTQAQKEFFAAFDERADAALIMDKYQKGDVRDKIENAVTLKKPWYEFTDFLPLEQQIEKIAR